MKHLLTAVSLAFVLSPRASTTIEFAAEEGISLTRTFVAVAEYELDSVVFSIDGETVHELEDVDLSTESVERIVVTDELLVVLDGRPTDIDRTFVELHQEGSESAGEEEHGSTSISQLEGRSVRFLWDDADEDWYAEASDEEGELDSDILEWLAGDMDLLAFLPGEDMEEGDEWEIEAQAYLALMWPGGLFGFYDEDTESDVDPMSQAVNRQMIENLTGEGTATLEEVVDGIAVLSVELDVESWADFEVEEEDQEIPVRLELERSITGEMRWSLSEGRLLEASFEADAERRRADTTLLETEDGEVELTRTVSYSGTITYEVVFELE